VTNDINTFYTEFYQDGQQSLDCKFIDAIIERSVRYYPNGSISSIDHYVNRKREGICEDYYDTPHNGVLKVRANYHEDRRHGLFEEFYENGQIKVRSNWDNGNQLGSPEAWLEDGTKHTGMIVQRIDGTRIFIIN
jgi:antitoxin component YwqK of YwqJK toxin-antitoxin module